MSTPYTTLIDAADLAAHHQDPQWAVVDCRFSLADPAAGRIAWQQATIPGAAYAHLNEDLSAPVVPGVTGRHPLPEISDLVAVLGRWGIDNATQVVAFDDMGGAMASRLWWMLQWLGHDAVAVLEGGMPAWRAGGHPLAPGQPSARTATFVPHRRPSLLVTAQQVEQALADPTVAVLDARAESRYLGQGETLDPIAGHIAGAISAPFGDNLTTDQRFAPSDAQRERYAALLGQRDPARAIVYCGSGVTACHNVLALAHLGQPMPRLYAGSWSEWITAPDRPRA